MKKLTLDEIDFVKRKIEQFISLPASPMRMTTPGKNQKQKQLSGLKRGRKQSSLKKPKSKTSIKEDANNQWKKKQSEILQFIIRQNRNKQSVLNKYLNSDKIHLKKREDLQQQKPKNQSNSQLNIQQLSQNNQNPLSKSFSFDDNFSSLKKVYKNIGELLTLKQTQQRKESSPVNQNPLFKLLQNVNSTSNLQKENIQKFNIETQSAIIKPSALKGKLSFINYDNQITKQPIDSNLNTKYRPSSTLKKDENLNKSNSKHILRSSGNNSQQPYFMVKSSSQLSIQKRNKSSSFSNIRSKQETQKNEDKRKSIIKKDVNYYKGVEKSQSKKSFQPYFDSQKHSVINQKQLNSRSYLRQFKQIQSFKYNSSSKKDLMKSKKDFSSSVYNRSFKKNPYEQTYQQKYLIEKYRSKELSPDQRKTLKSRYQLLDKRLDNILDSVKKQKQSINKSFNYLGDITLNQQRQDLKKADIPQEIMMYQKLSPLKKLLKVNKELRLKFQDQTD